MIKIFMKGVVDGEGVAVKKLFVGGGGFEGVTTPAPPPQKILIIHYGCLF